MTDHGPLVLVILDGWGLRAEREYNAIALARTPTYTELLERFPHACLEASGEAVGLPAGQMGNSEVGHMNMGAGRVVYQDITRIDKSIRDGEFFSNEALCAAMDRCAGGTHTLHLLGLVSDGGVHSHERHLHALIAMAAQRNVDRVFVHAITDGRDTSPTGGARYIARLQGVMSETGAGQIATISGRYYAMDRDQRWDRTERAFDALTIGAGASSRSAERLIADAYKRGTTDEFIEPCVIVDAEARPIGLIRKDDSVIFFNFRADRARQLTRALAFDDFDGFPRKAHLQIHVTTMTVYDATFHLPVGFTPQMFTGNFADVMAGAMLKNLRLAETEKYAHVTYFFNCGEERPYPREDRILVPSPKVPTYDLQPEMSANGITDQLVADLEDRKHDVVICNFANADMVGHTGNLEAAVAAVETLDKCLARIVTAARHVRGRLIITADHGNCEQMWDAATNGPHTAHTSNPVPVILVDDDHDGRVVRLREGGALCDVAPTMIGMLGLEQPKDMTGKDLRI